MLDTKSLRKLSSKLISEPENYMHSLRHNLDMYISHKDITLAEVSELADIPVNTLKSLMYGDSKDVHISTVIALAKVFNVSVDELIGCGTISPQTTQSLQIVRQLPESFTHFVRWAIHYHYDMQVNQRVSDKSVELMTPETAECGNLRMTNNFDVIDISDQPADVWPKVFMAIRMVNSNYAPLYFENDILLVANDREAKPTEQVIICIGENMWIVRAKHEQENGEWVTNYYSTRDGRLFARAKEVQLVLGYVVKVKRDVL